MLAVHSSGRVQPGPRHKGSSKDAMERLRGFGEHKNSAAERFQEIQMRPQMFHLFGGIATEQFGRIPARDERESECPKYTGESLGFARKLVTELHALEAGFPGLRQTDFEWRRATKLAHVVVGPTDRVGADPYCHRSSAPFPKFVSEVAAMYHELRKRGTSLLAAALSARSRSSCAPPALP